MAIKTYKDGTPFTGVIGRKTVAGAPFLVKDDAHPALILIPAAEPFGRTQRGAR